MSHGSWSRLMMYLSIGARVTAAAEQNWTGSWFSAHMEYAPQVGQSTVRTVVILTTGDYLRVEFSNLYGGIPLTIGHVRAANAAGEKDVTFRGHCRSRCRKAPLKLVMPSISRRRPAQSSRSLSAIEKRFLENLPSRGHR